MAIPTTREGLKQYCLRDLGAPVLEINVDDDQLEDRIDESLDYWRQYHYDGIEEIYLKQLIRASEITLTASVAGTFDTGEIITGVSSGAKATVCVKSVLMNAATIDAAARSASTKVSCAVNVCGGAHHGWRLL